MQCMSPTSRYVSDPVSTQHPVVSNNQQQIFSDFSADTRAIIGSCLASIQCLQTSDNCLDLFNLCHTQGPGAVAREMLEKVDVTEHSVECRIENILCHVKQDEVCLEQYQACRDLKAGSRNTISQDAVNTMGE